MKTFIVHVSVDADTKTRAEAIVRDCIDVGAEVNSFNAEKSECAVVLDDSTDEIEGTDFTPLRSEMIYHNPDLLEEAKSRCTDCEHETVKSDKYYCAEENCDITAVTQCPIQDGEEGHIG